jgi:Na+/melibiose symporter-like transporter
MVAPKLFIDLAPKPGLPDRIGGARVALLCVLFEAVGQALIWLTPSSALALVGVTLTGLSYSLVYLGLGVEAVRWSPAQPV